MAAAAAAFGEYSQYVTGIIEERRKEPRDDLISILVGAKDAGILDPDMDLEARGFEMEEGMELANDELIMLLVTLLVAGNETTRNALSGGMELLIRHPEARRALIEDPEKIPDAVEEMLRMVSPILSFSRTATRDPSGNRDEDVYEAPDEFRIDRRPQHVAFGIGAHFCLGANLARMELRVALRELLRRLPDMELTGDGPEIRPNALVRACVHMPVRFTREV
jgi:cytochrome P450 family 142 subfamily A polypeptide 1